MSVYRTYLELPVEIDYDFQPYEKQVLYPNDDAYPGCPASVTITSVWIGLTDVLEDLDATTIEILEAEILEGEVRK